MSEHTPTPWEARPHWRTRKPHAVYIIAGPYGKVADVELADNAHHIVRCVNSHADLLAALRERAVAAHYAERALSVEAGGVPYHDSLEFADCTQARCVKARATVEKAKPCR